MGVDSVEIVCNKRKDENRSGVTSKLIKPDTSYTSSRADTCVPPSLFSLLHSLASYLVKKNVSKKECW